MRMSHTRFRFLRGRPRQLVGRLGMGLPLIVLTVLIHVSCLGLISQTVAHGSVGHIVGRLHPKMAFVMVVGATTMLASCLHGFEAGLWACAYRFLGALPDFRTAMLYSLNAMTSYGHTNLAPETIGTLWELWRR